jgi:hypothetical protein
MESCLGCRGVQRASKESSNIDVKREELRSESLGRHCGRDRWSHPWQRAEIRERGWYCSMVVPHEYFCELFESNCSAVVTQA